MENTISYRIQNMVDKFMIPTMFINYEEILAELPEERREAVKKRTEELIAEEEIRQA